MKKKWSSKRLRNTFAQGATASRGSDADMVDSKPTPTAIQTLAQSTLHWSQWKTVLSGCPRSLHGSWCGYISYTSREIYHTKCPELLFYFIWVFQQLHLLLMNHRPLEPHSLRVNATISFFLPHSCLALPLSRYHHLGKGTSAYNQTLSSSPQNWSSRILSKTWWAL